MSSFTPENQRQLFKLVSAIEDNQGVMSPLIAVCDDMALRSRLIEQCQQDLPDEITIYPVELDQEEPSLRLGIWQRVQAEEALKAGQPGVFMVTGAENLLFVSLKGERTGIDKFMGYLQWGREGLMEFKYPIVLWITQQIYLQMINLTDSVRALDFWSWRRGSYQFEPEALVEAVWEPMGLISQPSLDRFEMEEEPQGLSIEDLEELIAKVERRNPKDPKLGSLYNQLGERYRWRLRQGQADDAAQERRKAEDCFQKAIQLQQELGLKSDLVNSFLNQGFLAYDDADYQKAMVAYKASLSLAKELTNHQGEAYSLSNLGNVYYSFGEYRKAIPFFEQSLEIAREIGDHKTEAYSLSNLGCAYHSLGEYQKSITFHEKSQEIWHEVGNASGEARCLNDLGYIYGSLGQRRKSITFYEQSWKISREIGDLEQQASSLGFLGLAYNSLEEYQKAISFHEKCLKFSRESGNHYVEAASLNNLGLAYDSLGEYQKAISFHEKSLEINREIGDRSGEGASLSNLGHAHKNLGEYETAAHYYQAALPILREIDYRPSIAATLLNLGNVSVKLNRKWPAIEAYQEARDLYQEMGVGYRVEDCDRRIREMNQMPVARDVVAPATQLPNRLQAKGNPFQRWFRHQNHLWQKHKHPLQKLWQFCRQLFLF